MPLLRCQDPECGHEWFEASRLAEGADCVECGGPTSIVDRDDEPEELLEAVGKSSERPAAPRYAFARDAARALLRRHGVDGLPIPVHEIARLEGLAVVESGSLGSNLRGRLVGDVIEVASGDPTVVQRFSIGHELGHHSMGTVHNENDRATEREADAFASELLVPRDRLKEYLKQETDVRELARAFFVSQQVMRIAIDQLGRGRR